MRWVWRAEAGGAKVEYGGLVLLVAAVTAAVIGFGMPGDVRSLIERGVCLVPGQEDCEQVVAGDGSDGDDSSADPEEEGDPEEGESQESDDPDSEAPEGEADSTFDWDALNEDYADYEEAQQELWEAEEAETEAEEEYAGLEEDLLGLLGELLGIEDAKNCITEGDIVACIWTVVGFAPWGKAAQVAKRIPAVARLVKRWRNVRSNRNAARADVSDARTRVDDAARSCRVSNSFTAGSHVRLADGSHVPIERVRVGDHVLVGVPSTGETASRQVEDTISRSGRRDMVEIGVAHTAPWAHDTVHVTADHPFWVDSRNVWEAAGDLRVGDRLSTESGSTASVRLLRSYEGEQPVFNLGVEGVPTYYASGEGPGVLVHNQSRPCPTKTDRIKEHLTESDLDAARRELDGEVVATKPDGTPWDHVTEVREAQAGLKKRIQQIQRRMEDSRTTQAERAELEEELGEASRLLDHSEGFVPSQ